MGLTFANKPSIMSVVFGRAYSRLNSRATIYMTDKDTYYFTVLTP